MKTQFKKAWRAFRRLGNAPDWRAFDAGMAGVDLRVAVAAGVCRCGVLR